MHVGGSIVRSTVVCLLCIPANQIGSMRYQISNTTLSRWSLVVRSKSVYGVDLLKERAI